MNLVLGIILGLVVLMSLVVAHEFGHFIAARRNGVWVEEFGIGFPPRAKAWLKNPEYTKWQAAKKKHKEQARAAHKSGKPIKPFALKKPKKWLPYPKSEWDKKPEHDLIFSINFLPIGGFCAMKGESDSDKRAESFGQATFWQKTKILFAGVTMNWLAAFVIFTILAFTGMPYFIENQFQIDSDIVLTGGQVSVAEVLDDTPAKAAGLLKDDIIDKVKVTNSDDEFTSILSTSDLIDFNNAHRGETVTYQIIRSVSNHTAREIETGTVMDCAIIPDVTPSSCRHYLNVVLGTQDAPYALGISMNQADQALYRSTWSAPLVGAATTVQLTGETFRGLGTAVYNLFSGVFKQFSGDETVKEQGRQAIQSAGDSVSGPVGILGVLFPAFVDSGPTNILFLAALISVSLACMNILPIPALDGGRWFLIALFRLRKKELSKETEERIVSRAFIVLLALIVLVTVLDIIRLF